MTRGPAEDAVDWEGLAEEELRLRAEPPQPRSYKAFRELSRFSDARDSNDGLSMAGQFIRLCIEHELPTVAVKAAFEAFDNAFLNVRSTDVDVAPEMVWWHIHKTRATLEDAGFFEQAGDLCSYAAVNWCENPTTRAATSLEAEQLFLKAGRSVDASQEAAAAARACLQYDNTTGAAAYFRRAADDLEGVSDYAELVRRIELLSLARGQLNCLLRYKDAGDTLLEERRIHRLQLRHSLRQVPPAERLAYAWQLVLSYIGWATTGYFERPARIVATALATMLGFGLLYYPGVAAATFQGLSSRDALTTFSETLHLSIITFSTVGYGNIHPTNGIARLLTGIEALLGVSLFGILIFTLTRRSGPR